MMIGGIATQHQRITGSDGVFLEQLLEKLYHKVHLDFHEYKRTSIERRIYRRLRATQSDSYQEYSDYLDLNPEEYDLLLKDLTINVTEFFRDDEPWQILQNEVFPDIISRRALSDNPNIPIRVWSAGCSSGQEIYSAAILLHELKEKLGAQFNLEMYATDIDEDSLSMARQGLYEPKFFNGVDNRIIDTHFEQNDLYAIRPCIKDCIHFNRHDLVLDAPLTEMDCIICRNVMIYFSRELQNKLYNNFYQSLRTGGYLFLGKAETLFGNVGENFTPVNKKWKIYRKN